MPAAAPARSQIQSARSCSSSAPRSAARPRWLATDPAPPGFQQHSFAIRGRVLFIWPTSDVERTMRVNSIRRFRRSLGLLALTVAFVAGGCQRHMIEPTSPKRDINAVLADHDKRLLSIPGVVGVYVGLLDDGR